MNVNLYVIENYREKDDFAVPKNKPKQTQLQTQRLSKLFLAFTFLYPNQSREPH